jgi:hypothetical protein
MRRARTRRLAVTLLLAGYPSLASAQAHSGGSTELADRARAALAPLSALVGQWEGDAWAVTGPGPRKRYRQFEDVVHGAGGTVLIVRGTGRSMQAPDSGQVAFEAAAMIWFDPDSSKLRMRAHRAEGLSIVPEIELRPDTLVWGFPVPGGRVRYVIAYNRTDWHEVGHFLREGAAPMLFIDMRLKRKP